MFELLSSADRHFVTSVSESMIVIDTDLAQGLPLTLIAHDQDFLRTAGWAMQSLVGFEILMQQYTASWLLKANVIRSVEDHARQRPVTGIRWVAVVVPAQ
jgi:hypothetical protein